MRPSPSFSPSTGFSIVEMLVVIAIIGVVSAIAIPLISDFTEQAEDIKAKRNAQNLVTSYASALAAGHNFADGETEVAAIVQNVATGVTLQLSQGTEDVFIGLPSLGAVQQAEVVPFLEIFNGRLVYKGG